ncbi:hypothetical protein WME79_36915 [Sorangium sp. So ce726]|uniref:hypothetical protein n=1 Tax=Sorangium sp. So ce726 TaxID=3133319 RepID=UPI003F5E9B88
MRGWFCFEPASSSSEIVLWWDDEAFTHAEVAPLLTASARPLVSMIKLYLSMPQDVLYWHSQVNSRLVQRLWQDMERFRTHVSRELERITGARVACREQ